MIKRRITLAFSRFLKTFPVVLVTGSRQVGKTTLVRKNLPDHKYVLLENPDQRNLALADPRRFLETHPSPVIFDEFQNVPELTSYLQGLIDQERKKNGQFVLTGSQNFLMMEQVNQSLAGRIGILTMFGLCSTELPAEALELNDVSIGKLLLRGTYPELWSNSEILERDWFASFVQTYIERDIRRLANIGDLLAFEKFVRVCASRTGQVLNLSDLSSDSGISVPTAQRWLSILQATYLVRLVQPYFVNITSRVRKAPKLYFMDTGLASYLMGFRDPATMMNSPQYGALFETLVYSDFIKQTSADSEIPEHFYLQTKSKVGADLLVRKNQKLMVIEIKGGKTFSTSLTDQLVAIHAVLGKQASDFFVVGPYSEHNRVTIRGVPIQVLPWTKLKF